MTSPAGASNGAAAPPEQQHYQTVGSPQVRPGGFVAGSPHHARQGSGLGLGSARGSLDSVHEEGPYRSGQGFAAVHCRCRGGLCCFALAGRRSWRHCHSMWGSPNLCAEGRCPYQIGAFFAAPTQGWQGESGLCILGGGVFLPVNTLSLSKTGVRASHRVAGAVGGVSCCVCGPNMQVSAVQVHTGLYNVCARRRPDCTAEG